MQHVVPSLIEAFERTHGGRPPDIVLHIGMASVRRYYAVETHAHRDGYAVTDVDGQTGAEYGEVLWKGMGLPESLQPGCGSVSGSEGDAACLTSPTTKSESEMITQPPLPSPAGTLLAPKPQPGPRPRPRPFDDLFLHTWRSHLPDPSSGTGSTDTDSDTGTNQDIDIRLSNDSGGYLCEFIYYASLAHALRSGRDRGVVFLHVPGWTDEQSVEKGRDVAVALVKALVGCWV